jgi:hypothetical protein
MLLSFVGLKGSFLLLPSSSLMLADCSSSTLLSPPSPLTSCALSNYRPLTLRSLTSIGETVYGEVKSSVIKVTTFAAWDLVRKPKDKGGLGVINLTVQNDALLLKHLDKFYRKENVQWVKLVWDKYYENSVPHLAREKGSFWWKHILRLNVFYSGVAICDAAKGDTIGFWDDLIDGSIHSLVFPNLMHLAKDLNISLFQLRQSHDLLGCFRITMSRPAYNEFLLLQDKLANLPQINPDDKDSWSLIWGVHSYSSKIFYQHQFKELQPERVMLWIWDSKFIPKIKFFSWLLLNDRLNTRNIFKRRKKVL